MLNYPPFNTIYRGLDVISFFFKKKILLARFIDEISACQLPLQVQMDPLSYTDNLIPRILFIRSSAHFFITSSLRISQIFSHNP